MEFSCLTGKEPITIAVSSLQVKVSEAADLGGKHGLSEVDSLRRELELLFLGPFEEVSEIFSFLGECCSEVERMLDIPGDLCTRGSHGSYGSKVGQKEHSIINSCSLISRFF